MFIYMYVLLGIVDVMELCWLQIAVGSYGVLQEYVFAFQASLSCGKLDTKECCSTPSKLIVLLETDLHLLSMLVADSAVG